MSKMRRFLTAAAFAACAFAPAAAMAKKIMFLSPPAASVPQMLNARTAFSAAVDGSLINNGGRLQGIGNLDYGMTYSDVDADGIFVVMATGVEASQTRITELENIIKNNNNNKGAIFMIFMSDEKPSNITGFADVITNNTDASFTIDTTTPAQTITAQRNDSDNSGLPRPIGFFPKEISGTQSTYFTGVSTGNALYLTPGGATGEAYGVFVPHAQSNGGGGACVLFFTDTSMWDDANSDANSRKKLAQDLIVGAQASCRYNGSDPLVLYLSTAESYGVQRGTPGYCAAAASYSGTAFINNAITNFRAEAGESNVINRAGALSTDYQIAQKTSASPFTNTSVVWNPDDFDALGAGDIVVVQTAYHLMAKEKADEIVKQINSRSDLTFILLLDSCTQCGLDSESCTNDDHLVNLNNILGGVTPPGWDLKPAAMVNSENWTTTLNAYGRSPYARSLAQFLPTVSGNTSGASGNTTGALQCVPQQNVLFPVPAPQYDTQGGNRRYQYQDNGYGADKGIGWYCNGIDTVADHHKYLDPNCTFSYTDLSSWPELNASSSLGLLVPFWQSAGACIYFGQDNNMFDSTRCQTRISQGVPTTFPNQCDKLVDMFMSLPTGACNESMTQDNAWSTCTNSDCVLLEAPADVEDDKDLAVLPTHDSDPNGELMCKAKIWCNSNEASRKKYCEDGEDPSTHCCKAKPICTEGQAISSPCTCAAPMQDDGNGKCVTPPTPPTPVPVCTDGQAIASPCTCQAPMVDDGGICIANSPICQPPNGCSSAPAAGWPALLGLGGVLPLLAAARRRRRK